MRLKKYLTRPSASFKRKTYFFWICDDQTVSKLHWKMRDQKTFFFFQFLKSTGVTAPVDEHSAKRLAYPTQAALSDEPPANN